MGTCRKTRYVWNKATHTHGIDRSGCEPRYTIKSIVRGAMRRDSHV